MGGPILGKSQNYGFFLKWICLFVHPEIIILILLLLF